MIIRLGSNIIDTESGFVIIKVDEQSARVTNVKDFYIKSSDDEWNQMLLEYGFIAEESEEDNPVDNTTQWGINQT